MATATLPSPATERRIGHLELLTGCTFFALPEPLQGEQLERHVAHLLQTLYGDRSPEREPDVAVALRGLYGGRS